MSLDRLDRLVLAGSAPRAVPDTEVPHPATAHGREHAGAPTRPVVPIGEVIHSKRGPRFVDYAGCPMCGHHRIGVVYLGVSIKGPKMHELFAHSPGSASSRRGEPRCLGAGLRVVFVGGSWQGETA